MNKFRIRHIGVSKGVCFGKIPNAFRKAFAFGVGSEGDPNDRVELKVSCSVNRVWQVTSVVSKRLQIPTVAVFKT